MSLDKFWVVEYNEIDDQWHVSTVGDMLVNNVNSFIKEDCLRWIPLAICESHDEAKAAVKRLRFISKNRGPLGGGAKSIADCLPSVIEKIKQHVEEKK